MNAAIGFMIISMRKVFSEINLQWNQKKDGIGCADQQPESVPGFVALDIKGAPPARRQLRDSRLADGAPLNERGFAGMPLRRTGKGGGTH